MTGATQVSSTRRRDRPGIAIALLLPAVTIGLLVSTQIRAQSDRSPLTTRYQLTLVEVATDLRREQTDLRGQLTALRQQLDQIQRDGARLDSAAAALQPEIDALKRDAGLVEERGSGVVVTLDDARLPPASGTIELAIVHAQDLTDIVNTAWSAGARAISINGERIVGTSSCVGATIQINGILMSPPFAISIVGTPEPLLTALSQGSGLADLRRRRDVFGLAFDISRDTDLVAPVFAGPIRARYATVRP
jgi:uncharacterized protein YlxW (UPF0749 family)